MKDRTTTRKRMLMKVDCFSAGQFKGVLLVRDLSEMGIGGVLDCERAPTKGQEVTLVFHGQTNVEGQVAWSDGRRIGVRFYVPTDLDQVSPHANRSVDSPQIAEWARPSKSFKRPPIGKISSNIGGRLG